MAYRNLKYQDYVYTPAGSKAISEKALRREYSRLRAVAVKRLKRIGESEFAGYDIFRSYDGVFKKLAEFENERDLRYTFAKLYNFLNVKTSTIKGLKESKFKTISIYHERGYHFINDENYNDIMHFFDLLRARNLDMLYGSDKVVEELEKTQKEGVLNADTLQATIERMSEVLYD